MRMQRFVCPVLAPFRSSAHCASIRLLDETIGSVRFACWHGRLSGQGFSVNSYSHESSTWLEQIVRFAWPPTSELNEERRLLTFDRISVRYGAGVQAIEDVSFEVPPGTMCAIIGGNGAGKTTLMRAVSGTLGYHGGRIVAGEIRLGDVRIDRLNPHRIVQHGVALVPEGRHVFAELTIEENLEAGAASVRSAKLRQQRLETAYEMFEVLGRRRAQRASLLSGGEQQMLAIARGMMSGPEVLLLDEPSLGIAPKVVQYIGETLCRINELGTTVVLVEQNAAMALGIADQGLVIERGSISMRGPAAELRESDEIRRMYLGGSADEAADESSGGVPTRHATLGRWEA